jgi:hypothetical protein
MKIVRLTMALLIVVALCILSFIQVLAQEEDCANDWFISYTLELRPDFWTEGVHNYIFEWSIDGVPQLSEPIFFDVTEDAPLYDGQVHLRFWGLKTAPRWTDLTEINPSQDTVFHIAEVAMDSSRRDAMETLEGISSRIKWDGGDWIDLSEGPIINGCAWFQDSYLFNRSWGPPYKR